MCNFFHISYRNTSSLTTTLTHEILYFIIKQLTVFSMFQNIQTGSGAHPASYSVGNRVPYYGQSGQEIYITTHLHLVQRLRMSGPIHPLPLYAFMVLTEKSLPSILTKLLHNCKHFQENVTPEEKLVIIQLCKCFLITGKKIIT